MGSTRLLHLRNQSSIDQHGGGARGWGALLQREGKSVGELCPTLEGRGPGPGQGRVGAAVAPTLKREVL